MPTSTMRCAARTSAVHRRAKRTSQSFFMSDDDTFVSYSRERGGHPMRQLLFILVALSLCASAAASVKPVGSKEMDAKQSAALFVGVSEFKYGRLAPVQFALDDAIDLAYELAIDHDPILVPP